MFLRFAATRRCREQRCEERSKAPREVPRPFRFAVTLFDASCVWRYTHPNFPRSFSSSLSSSIYLFIKLLRFFLFSLSLALSLSLSQSLLFLPAYIALVKITYGKSRYIGVEIGACHCEIFVGEAELLELSLPLRKRLGLHLCLVVHKSC